MKHSEARLPPKTHSVFKTKTTSPGWGRSLFRYRLHLPGNPSLALGQEKKKSVSISNFVFLIQMMYPSSLYPNPESNL